MNTTTTTHKSETAAQDHEDDEGLKVLVLRHLEHEASNAPPDATKLRLSQGLYTLPLHANLEQRTHTSECLFS